MSSEPTKPAVIDADAVIATGSNESPRPVVSERQVLLRATAVVLEAMSFKARQGDLEAIEALLPFARSFAAQAKAQPAENEPSASTDDVRARDYPLELADGLAIRAAQASEEGDPVAAGLAELAIKLINEHPDDGSNSVPVMVNVSIVLRNAGKSEEALVLLSEAKEKARKLPDSNSLRIYMLVCCLANLANCARSLKHIDLAGTTANELLLLGLAEGKGDLQEAKDRLFIGTELAGLGRVEDALACVKKSVEVLDAQPKSGPNVEETRELTAQSLQNLLRAYLNLGRRAEVQSTINRLHREFNLKFRGPGIPAPQEPGEADDPIAAKVTAALAPAHPDHPDHKHGQDDEAPIPVVSVGRDFKLEDFEPTGKKN